MSSDDLKPVPLIQSNGNYMIFNATDYIRIRRDHGIVGNLIGVTASHTYDSTISGLPAMYTAIEAKLLIDERIAVLTKTPDAPNDKVQEEYQALLKEHIVGQAEKQIDKSREKNERNILYQVPTECSYREDTPEHPTGALTAPTVDPLRYDVFYDLWERDFFITNGHSFGGDFLLYPQDPIVCHASHVVHILDQPVVTIRDFITMNRLCVGVKKECIFAYRDPDDERAIKYHSSSWDSTWDK